MSTVCARACVRVRACMHVCVCVGGGGGARVLLYACVHVCAWRAHVKDSLEVRGGEGGGKQTDIHADKQIITESLFEFKLSSVYHWLYTWP